MGAGTPLHWKPSPLIFFTKKERGMVRLAGGSAGALAWGPGGGRRPVGRDWLSARGFSTGQLPAGGRAAARSRHRWRRPRLWLGLPLGLGGGGAQTGDRWSCAQHSGCRLYMGRRLEEIRWSPSNGTVQRSNPSNVPQDNRSAHVPLNRQRWGQARRREQRAGRRGESEGEKGAEI